MKLIKKAIKLVADKIKSKEFEEAELICEQTLRVDSENLDALYLLSIIKNKLSKKEEFKECFDKIIKLTPNDFNANNSLGLAHLHMGELDTAISYFKKSVDLEPKNPMGWSNLGCQFRVKKQYFESIDCFKKAIKLSDQKSPQLYVNIAGSYAENLDLKNAIKNLKQAIKIDTNFHAAHVDLACSYFLQGKFNKASKHYLHRFDHFDYLKSKINNFDFNKKWNGKKIKQNKTILFFCEQGLGDAINFIRFADNFKEKYPKVKVKILVPKDLFGLLKTTQENAITELEEHDYWCPIMDLPYYLGIDQEFIKNKYRPYIKENKKCDYSYFKDFYKIGICWAGNPEHPKDAERSCYLDHFKAIYNIPNVKLFALQKDLRSRMWPFLKNPVDLADCSSIKLVNMNSHMNSWEDTASIMAGLDLVISVDTSVLHLAGAMGKQTIAALSYLPDWRWEIEAKNSYWYPNMNIFRQKTRNDWHSVFCEIKSHICNNILKCN